MPENKLGADFTSLLIGAKTNLELNIYIILISQFVNYYIIISMSCCKKILTNLNRLKHINLLVTFIYYG